jgi:hypothetical protein
MKGLVSFSRRAAGTAAVTNKYVVAASNEDVAGRKGLLSYSRQAAGQQQEHEHHPRASECNEEVLLFCVM